MLLIGIEGLELTAKDKRHIAQPQTSGLILFSRNYASRQQLKALVAAIRHIRPEKSFIIGVDQEGGRVQRFIQGFNRLPPLELIGKVWENSRQKAISLAEEHAWLMASEIRAMDIDLSFAPVLDLARGNLAIGNRALHEDPEVVATLGQAYMRGMHRAGMAVTIKHFPGHGSVREDTHVSEAIDKRDFASMDANDLVPFKQTIAQGVEAVMMAHVLYPQVDKQSAGQSAYWIDTILRQKLGFKGVVMGDDVSMVAAQSAGDMQTRVRAHLQAGCDLVLACQPEAVADALEVTKGQTPCAQDKLAPLSGAYPVSWERLVDDSAYHDTCERIHDLSRSIA